MVASTLIPRSEKWSSAGAHIPLVHNYYCKSKIKVWFVLSLHVYFFSKWLPSSQGTNMFKLCGSNYYRGVYGSWGKLVRHHGSHELRKFGNLWLINISSCLFYCYPLLVHLALSLLSQHTLHCDKCVLTQLLFLYMINIFERTVNVELLSK